MALPIVIKTLFKNFKVISIALAIGAAVSFGTGLYFHGKKVQSLQSQIELLESQAESERIVREIVDDASVRNQEQRNNIEQASSDAREEIREAKDEDQSVREYLSTDIPERVQLARERARCVSLPYTCKSDATEQDSSE